MCHTVAVKAEELKRQQAKLEASELMRQNLSYEKDHLLREIASCKDFEIEELVKLCESEGFDSVVSYLGLSQGNNDGTDFLTEPMDHVVHTGIMEKLTQEIEERKRLQAELGKLQAQCASIQQQNKKKTSFLQNLPYHVKQIERSTIPLQKFFDVKGNFTGTQRKERYERARKLDAPLYTLCCQLEAYADAFDHTASVNIINTSTVQSKIVTKGEIIVDASLMSDFSLRFDINPPTEYDASPMSIYFFFVPSMNIVTAHCNEDPILLDDLFPGDDGHDIPKLNHHRLQVKSLDTIYGKPYKWVQWIAGFKFLPENNSSLELQLEHELAAVMSQLLLRIRSRSILQKITNSFSKLPNPASFPTHDSLCTFFSSLSKSNSSSLASWCETADEDDKSYFHDDCSNNCFFYKASIRRKTQYLDLLVMISSAYPVVAPKWIIKKRITSTHGEKHAEFDNDIHEIQTIVNAQYMSLVSKSDDQLDLKCMDYILSHQLRFITIAFSCLGEEDSSMVWRRAIENNL